MNKKLLFSISGLGLLLILSACGSSTTASLNSGGQTPAKNIGTNRRPDYGQPTSSPEIRGLVKTIIGNEVNILKMDQVRGATSTEARASSTPRMPSLSLAGTESGGGRGPGGGFGGGRGQGGDTGAATDRTAMLARVKAMSTGEEKVIIPVGIKMLKADPNSSAGKRTMIEATLSDVIADKMLTIWLDNSVTDKKVASFVMIN